MQRNHAPSPARRRWLVAVTVAALLCLPLGPAAADTPPEDRAAALVRPSMVYLETHWSAFVRDHDGDWLNGGGAYEWTSRCSGFIVNPSGYIVTAGHCVDDTLEGARGQAISYGVDEWVANGWALAEERAELTQLAYANWLVEGLGGGSPPDRQVYVQHGVAVSGLTAGQAWPARVIELKPLSQGDLALLKVEHNNLPVVEIAPPGDVPLGTSVLSVGYPATSDMVADQSLEPTYKDGKISSRKTRDGGLLPVYEISAALSGGMSGGPTVGLDGRVLGVNSFSISGEIQQFNFLSPPSMINEMLARNGVPNELGAVDRLYREALERFFADDYAAAIERFDDVLSRVPSHQQAQELRVRAVEGAAAQPVASPEPVLDPDEAGAGPLSGATPAADTEPAAAEPAAEEPAAAPAADERAPASATASPLLLAALAVAVLAALGASTAAVLLARGRRAPAPERPVVGPLADGNGLAHCAGCGAELAPEARFCGSCGRARLPEASGTPERL